MSSDPIYAEPYIPSDDNSPRTDNRVITTFVGVEIYEPYLTQYLEYVKQNPDKTGDLKLVSTENKGSTTHPETTYICSRTSFHQVNVDDMIDTNHSFWMNTQLGLKAFERLGTMIKMTSINPRIFSMNKKVTADFNLIET